MKKQIVILSLILSSISYAGGSDVGNAGVQSEDARGNARVSPVYNATTSEKADLEQALSNAIPSDSDIVCKNTVVVATGGTTNSSVGGICKIAGVIKVACLNQMLGTVTAEKLSTQNLTKEYQILSLIASECTGG